MPAITLAEGFSLTPLKRRSSVPYEAMLSHREVGHELEQSRVRHRKPGFIPYPLQYDDRNVLDFSTWDHLFFTRVYKRMTLHEFEKPPKRILDLGCGNGTWIIMASKMWKESTFVGFDISPLQPGLHRLIDSDLARRISWVRGNFLEKLPFDDEEFDLIVVHSIGLGVPEDEWQDVIEEISRILKPDGIFELFEEEIIFPCPEPPPDKVEESTMSSLRTPSESSTLSFTMNDSSSFKPRSFSSSFKSTYSITSPLTLIPPTLYDDISEHQISYSEAQFRRDHSMLHEAFQHMLAERFINPKISVVLPFYLQAAFAEVQNYQKVNIYLPPPSADTKTATTTYRQSTDSGHLVHFKPVAPLVNWPRDNSHIDYIPSLDSIATSQTARMHLARTIQLFNACKENLWIEYEKLHRHERRIPNIRLDREDFDTYFWNWQCDMEDRAGMRSMLESQLSWKEPANLGRPDWRLWRTKDAEFGFDPSTLPSEPSERNLCRSFRGFVCKKPLQQKTPQAKSPGSQLTSQRLEVPSLT